MASRSDQVKSKNIQQRWSTVECHCRVIATKIPSVNLDVGGSAEKRWVDMIILPGKVVPVWLVGLCRRLGSILCLPTFLVIIGQGSRD